MGITDASGGMKREDLDRMKYIREQIEKAVLPYRHNTEAALVCGALFQVARTLLLLYPEATREDLLKGAIAFLKGEDLDAPDVPGGTRGRILQ